MEGLRHQDFDSIPVFQQYRRRTTDITLDTNYFRKFSVHGDLRWGKRVNYDSPGILAPFLASRTSADIQVTVRPTRSLKIDNTYLFFGLHHCENCDTPLEA